MDKRGRVFCLVRQVWVSATPEELVRQKFLSEMIHILGYPVSSLALEKELNKLPHISLQTIEIPQRRADIICFAKDIHPQHMLYPLLLIECKAVSINKKVIEQVVGYNQALKAYFVCVVNQSDKRTGWYDSEKSTYTFIDHLPTYSQLLDAVSILS